MKTQFYFNINYNCNSLCRFCAANYQGEKQKIELTLTEVTDVLVERNAGPQDLIIINGGEPTIHSQFIEILSRASSTGAEIKLFTNGLKLAHRVFFDHICQYDKKTLLTIPIFSDSPEQHDYLTGRKGNFEKLWSGLINLSSALKEHRARFEVEIKLLLSRASAPVNHKILNMVSRSFPGLFRYSLNPLILSDTVKNNADMFIDSFTSMQNSIMLVMEAAASEQISLSCSLLPLCVLPAACRNQYIPSRASDTMYGQVIYADPYRVLDEYMDRYSFIGCQGCRCKDRCQGFAQDYLDYFGSGEIKPIYDNC